MLRVNNLTKTFGSIKAVDDLSFSLEAGKTYAFVGPNGAGKTTTMRIIATLEDPTAGEVFIEDRSTFEDPYALRRLIGYMPDYCGTYPDLTVRDYIEFYARAYELDGKARKSRIDKIMDFTGLIKLDGKPVETLSKGMQQRLNLGRALINDPKLLILDEPAAGLDPRARIELRYLIKNLAEQGKTIFVSSHILSELAEICDEMLIIDKGRLITFGSVEQIQANMQKTMEVSLRLVSSDDLDRLERFLLERPNVSEIRVKANGTMTFAFLEDKSRIPVLLREILLADFQVLEFKPVILSMEDVFMKITAESES